MIDAAAVIEFPPAYAPDAPRAQVRALFFLAGWREHATAARGMRPCLVCVDAPPPSVCWLAEQAGARLIHRPPFAPGDGRTWRRGCAWDEADGDAARRLVLDAEVLAVGDPVPALSGWRGETLLAAAPAEKASLPDACWPGIYRAVGLSMPSERIRPLRASLGLPFGETGPDMPPYYHPAAILTPGGKTFGETWARHAARLAAAWPTLEGLSADHRASASTVERAALATAVWALRASAGENGLACETLPRGWDGRRVCLEGGVGMDQMALLHIPGLFGELTDLAQVRMWLEAYPVRWREALLDAARRRGDGSPKTQRWITRQTRRMEEALRRLYRRHVRPALRMGGEIG